MNDERLRVKDPRKAMLLAAIPGLFGVIGLGHFYAGYPKRGTFLMLTNLFALFYAIGSFHYGYFTIGVIVSILVVALWCGQIKEARDKARDHNHFQEMERIWYGDLHGNKGAFSVGSVDCVMENPRNEADFRIVFKVCIFGIVFSVLLSFGYWSPLPFIGGIGVVTFIWVVQWYAAYYRHPRRIGFGEKGMELHIPEPYSQGPLDGIGGHMAQPRARSDRRSVLHGLLRDPLAFVAFPLGDGDAAPLPRGHRARAPTHHHG